MACGCGGTNGGSGGCGGDKPLANPLLETELAHELPQAAASAVVEFDPAPAAPGADAEPLLIASSEQDWPRIRVNGVLIEPEAMALELQYHPAAEQSEAMFLAAQALVIRELLQQRCSELSVKVEAGIGESQEEAAIRSLIELEVPVPEADESVCEHFYASNLPRFVSAPLLAARHILLECAPDDIEARISKREQRVDGPRQIRGRPEQRSDTEVKPYVSAEVGFVRTAEREEQESGRQQCSDRRKQIPPEIGLKNRSGCVECEVDENNDNRPDNAFVVHLLSPIHRFYQKIQPLIRLLYFSNRLIKRWKSGDQNRHFTSADQLFL